MSIPREGSRATAEGLLVSIHPDVCLTPMGNMMVPVPYTIWARQSDEANTTPTVRFTAQRTHNLGSLITTCHGDEAGTGGGVKSGTHHGICEPLDHSATVRAQGKPLVRHADTWWMNTRNTQGRLMYVKEPDEASPTPQSRQSWMAPTPASTQSGPVMSDAPDPQAQFWKPGSQLALLDTGAYARQLAAAEAEVAAAEAEVAAVAARGGAAVSSEAEAGAAGAEFGPVEWGLAAVIIGGTVVYGGYQLYRARQKLAEAQAKLKALQAKERRGATVGRTEANVNVSGSTKSACDEICEVACVCRKDKGDHHTYTACVSRKLRERYYDPNGPKYPDKSPRRPRAPAADGPRPEVSYKQDEHGIYRPVMSKTDTDMPSSQIPITGAPRPDISWWKYGKLWKIFEIKFKDKTNTTMQEAGVYRELTAEQGLDPENYLIHLDIDKDCDCSSEGGKASETGSQKCKD
ncbi:DUF4150 domain-containing protein [Methylobacterium radiotolerans]|uniref:DUF4150 domain-containing protein n=1 Tax=Methylobacterium radiotolerans TaxID=31998 RepID=UPI0009765CE3|nr:DUF4150 domain-containing protein [Methylobacterium radiotolerans]